jgi:hypothetical protein
VGLDWQEVTAQAEMPVGQGIPEEGRGQWELKTCWIDENAPSRSLVWDVDLEEGESLHLSIADLQQYSYVYVNGKLVKFHVATGSAYSDLSYNEFSLSDAVQPGSNRVELGMLGWETDEHPTYEAVSVPLRPESVGQLGFHAF